VHELSKLVRWWPRRPRRVNRPFSGFTQRRPENLAQSTLLECKVAEGLGARGEYVTKAEDFKAVLERSWQIEVKEGVSTLIDCQAIKESWTNQYPPGMPQNSFPTLLVVGLG
jgi:hypothetical protein